MANQTTYSLPRIGDNAPDFEAITTTGKLKANEYNKGRWVILLSHPAGCTPVCTTEMDGFAQEKEFFSVHNNFQLIEINP